MALLYVTEFAEVAIGPAGRVGQFAQQPELANQAIVIGAGSLASNAFNTNTRFVRLHTDVSCVIEFGTAPTAVVNTTGRMAANQTEYHGVPEGQSFKVAVIANA